MAKTVSELPCSDCPKFAAGTSGGTQGGFTKRDARSNFQKLQTVMGLLLFISAGTGSYLLATDRSLWLLAVSHAVGLIIIVVIDVFLGMLSLISPKSAYIPSVAAALLGLILQLGDILTAPQYGLTVPYFANYLFGLWAFDLLLAIQVAIMVVGVAGRPYALQLSRRRTRKGSEMHVTKRGFLKSLVGIAGAVGLGVLLSSIKLPAGTLQTTTQTGTVQGSVANVNSLKIGVPVYFDYPSGYPNALVKNSDGSLTALSMLCTHVCCQCSFDSASKVFYCPCHGSVFDISGKVVNGPATVDLPVIQLRVDGSGNVFPTGVTNPGPCQV